MKNALKCPQTFQTTSDACFSRGRKLGALIALAAQMAVLGVAFLVVGLACWALGKPGGR